jgi:cytidine deaminase
MSTEPQNFQQVHLESVKQMPAGLTTRAPEGHLPGEVAASSAMPLDQSLVDAAIRQALERFPSGYAGAAAIRTHTGRTITSVSFDAPNDAVSLCHEAGAFCEANRLGEQVVASVCVSRSEPGRPFLILPPCGICQERLALWGPKVLVAVSVPGQPGQWQPKHLEEVNPHYWLDTVRDAQE